MGDEVVDDVRHPTNIVGAGRSVTVQSGCLDGQAEWMTTLRLGVSPPWGEFSRRACFADSLPKLYAVAAMGPAFPPHLRNLHRSALNPRPDSLQELMNPLSWASSKGAPGVERLARIATKRRIFTRSP